MKTMKKVLALVTTLAMVLTMLVATGLTAFAAEGDVTITINRDSSYDSSATGDREFTAYKVFDATYDSNTASGGGSDAGVPGAIANTGEGFSYTLPADSALVAKLGTWDDENKTWTKASGNNWFKLTKVSGKYVVQWDNESTDADTVQAAAKWLVDNHVYSDPSYPLTKAEDGKSWSATVPKGYYVIVSSEGKNLVAATTDIEINEKNTYPTIEKKQKDEDAEAYADTKVDVAIGDIIDYQVTVKVPADANKDIVVKDTMTSGIEYDTETGLSFSPSLTADTDYVAGAASATGWTVTIKPTDATKGKDIVITFKAKVVSAVLSDIPTEATETAPASGRRNTVELKYNNNHYVMTDEVEFTTYYTGIEKVDGKDKNVKLEKVKFTLKEDGTEFKVTKTEAGYYIPDENGSSDVVTDENGLIIIRGLDKDKTYTLTETETNDGYNLLDGDVTLTLVEDKSADIPTDATFAQVQNNKGTVLPGTGGIGTTIFYILGSALVIGCGIVLISRKRMNNK